jgi:hypothetical protein
MSAFIAVLGIVITLLLAVYESVDSVWCGRWYDPPCGAEQHPLGGRHHGRVRCDHRSALGWRWAGSS